MGRARVRGGAECTVEVFESVFVRLHLPIARGAEYRRRMLNRLTSGRGHGVNGGCRWITRGYSSSSRHRHTDGRGRRTYLRLTQRARRPILLSFGLLSLHGSGITRKLMNGLLGGLFVCLVFNVPEHIAY